MTDHGGPREDQASGLAWQGSEVLGLSGPSSKRVRLRDVQQELDALWQAAGREAQDRSQGGVVRLREANLMVYIPHDGSAERVQEAIADTAGRHPARAIVLLDVGVQSATNEGHPVEESLPGEEGAEVWVTAACRSVQVGDRSLCWEQITIPARGEVSRYLHAAAVSLLVPELPIALWWPGQALFSGRTFKRLAEVADLVVIDSNAVGNGATFLNNLAGLLRDVNRNYGVDDFNWMRLLPWRTLVAGVFDEPVRRPWLSQVSRVRISYAQSAYNEGRGSGACGVVLRSLLMVSWLSTRLGWQTTDQGWREEKNFATAQLSRRGSRSRSREDGVSDDVEICLSRIDHVGLEGGGLVEVSLEIAAGSASGETPDSGGDKVVMRLSDTGDVGTARVWEGDHSVSVGSVDMSHMTEGRLLSQCLDFLGADTVAEEAALFAAELVSLPGAQALWR